MNAVVHPERRGHIFFFFFFFFFFLFSAVDTAAATTSVLLLTAILIIIVIVLRYHRIDNLASLQSLLLVASSPIAVDSPRCKVYTDTDSTSITSLRFRCLPNTFLIGASSGHITLTCAISLIPLSVAESMQLITTPRSIDLIGNFPFPYQLELLEEWASSLWFK